MNIKKKFLQMVFPIFLILVIYIAQVHGGSLEKCNKYEGSRGRLAVCQAELKNCETQLYNSNVKKLEYEIVALSACKGKLTNEVNELERKLIECKTRSKDLNNQIKCLTVKKNTLLGQIKRLEDKIAELECKIAKEQGKCDNEALKAEAAVLNQELNLLSTTENDLKNKLEQCRQDDLNCHTSLDNITIYYNQCETDLQAMIAKNATCENLANTLKNELSALNSALVECLQNSAGNATAAINCQQEFDSKTAQLALCQQDLINCNGENVNKNDLISACTASLNENKGLNENCQSSLTLCNSLRQTCINKFNAVLSQCQTQGRNIRLVSTTTGVYSFRFGSTAYTWFEANNFCELNGLKLLELNNATEETVIATNLLSNGVPPGTTFWTGANDLNAESIWTYTGHVSPPNTAYFDWLSGEPNNFNQNENCGIVQLTSGNFLKAIDTDCKSNSVTNIICEYPDPCATLFLSFFPPT